MDVKLDEKYRRNYSNDVNVVELHVCLKSVFSWNVIRFWNVFHEMTHLIIDESFPTDSIWFITLQIVIQHALQLINNNQKPCLKRASKYSILHNKWQPKIVFEMSVQL